MKGSIPLFCLILTLPICAEKFGTICESFKYPSLSVDGERVYIKDGYSCTVHVYELKGLRHLGQFCKKGEGPGEFKTGPFLRVYPQFLLLSDDMKLAFFTKEGILQKEMKTKSNSFNYQSIGDNYVCVTMAHDEKNEVSEQTVRILDAKLEFSKDIWKKKDKIPFFGTGGPKTDRPMIRDYFNFIAWRDRLYIGDTERGFYFAVFDQWGKLLYEINIPYEKRKVTQADRDRIMGDFKQGMGKYWEQEKKIYNFVFPEYFPAYSYFYVKDDRIYVYTHQKKDQHREVVVFDLKGNRLMNSTIPLGFGISTIHDGIFYYLKENEEEECWELHAEKII